MKTRLHIGTVLLQGWELGARCTTDAYLVCTPEFRLSSIAQLEKIRSYVKSSEGLMSSDDNVEDAGELVWEELSA